jgi:hypothetical protein
MPTPIARERNPNGTFVTGALIKQYRKKSVDGKPQHIHRLRAERALGKPLPSGAEVHHVDGTRDEDGPLVICQDKAYHKLLHARMRIKAAGGNPNTDRICADCQVVKPIDQFHQAATKMDKFGQWHCRFCPVQLERRRMRYAMRRQRAG